MSATDLGQPVRSARTRPDRCPGVLRPWPAHDGALARVRVPGGRLPTAALLGLVGVAQQYGDGRVRVTGRANLQLRSLPQVDGALPAAVVDAVEATGLLPSRSHDLARNVLCSPQTGRAGGLADLRPVVAELDRAICASPALATLPGRFLFTLDDGRGDVRGRHVDLGVDALDARRARVRVGSEDRDVVRLDRVAEVLVGLAEDFVRSRGTGPEAPWHVDEAFAGRVGAADADHPLPYGPVPGGDHVSVTDDGIDSTTAADWAARTPEVVVTPWHGVLI